MKRRDFFKTSIVTAVSLGLPATTALAARTDTGNATTGSGWPEAPLEEKVTQLRVGTLATAELRDANRRAREAGRPQRFIDPPDDENNYWAEAIRRGKRYFYRVGSTTVECSENEYSCVIANPTAYYFSRALVLHFRIKRKRDGLPALS